MYTFTYRGGDKQEFATPSQAVTYFNNRGWGMWNWQIQKNGEQITLDQFNEDLDNQAVTHYRFASAFELANWINTNIKCPLEGERLMTQGVRNKNSNYLITIK